MTVRQVHQWLASLPEDWMALTKANDVTTRSLCDRVRITLGLLPSCFGSYEGRYPSELPKDFALSEQQGKAWSELGLNPTQHPAGPRDESGPSTDPETLGPERA